MSLIAFPLNRRREFIRRLGAQVLARTPTLGITHLKHQLRRQAKSLRHKGFDEAVVEREIASLRRAVCREIEKQMPPPSNDGQWDTSA